MPGPASTTLLKMLNMGPLSCNSANLSHRCFLLVTVLFCINFIGGQTTQHFIMDIGNSGISQLIVLDGSITGLNPGDEVGIFDEDGLISFGDCSSQYGNLLVGAGVWQNDQLAISAIGAVDNCIFGGIQVPGYVEGHAITLRVWNSFSDTEYAITPEFTMGSGIFGELLTVISDIRYYSPAWYGSPPETPMTIQIHEATVESFSLQPGDEIAVFDGDICVGSVKVQQTGNLPQLLAGADDQNTPETDGFIPGNEMIFKIWRSWDAFEETWLDLTLSGDDVFTPNGYSEVWLTGLAADEAGYPENIHIVSAYPNPFNSQLSIRYEVGELTVLSVDIVDLTGSPVEQLISSLHHPGAYELRWEPVSVSSGVYLVRITTPKATGSYPVILLK